MQYNFTIEHQRWNTGFRISYVGTNTREGDYTMNVNQPVADARAYVDKPRLFPGYPAINFRTNGAGHTVGRWFDPTAFAPPQAGRFGTSAKGVIIGPGNVVFDAGLAKRIRMSERMGLRFELTATNVLNHPSYGNPAVMISSAATAGVISSVKDSSDLDQSGARSFRTAIRLEW
jgi:hypothetical protein